MDPHLEDGEEKELVSSSPDSGISVPDPEESPETQIRKAKLGRQKELTEASVYQHTQVQNSNANTLNPLFFKCHQSIDNRKWALLKSLSQDSEYSLDCSLDDSLFDAEGILSELGFAGTRDPTIPERFLPSLMQRLSKFPESEMQTLNDRILHSIGCFRRKEGKRRLFRNLSTGKDPLMGPVTQNSLSCPATNSYPLLRSNTGPAAFTYDDIPQGSAANSSLQGSKEHSLVEDMDSLPQSPIAILVSQPSVDLSPNCDSLDSTSCVDFVVETADEKIRQSVSNYEPGHKPIDYLYDKANVQFENFQEADLASYTKRDVQSDKSEEVNFTNSKSSSSDSSETQVVEDRRICKSSSIPTEDSSKEMAVEPGMKSDPKKLPLRRASSPQSLETISKLSDSLRNSTLTCFQGESNLPSMFSKSEDPFEISSLSYSVDEHLKQVSSGNRNSLKSVDKIINDDKPKTEKKSNASRKFDYSRTSSLTNFLTSMLNAEGDNPCRDTSKLVENALLTNNDEYVKNDPIIQNDQQRENEEIQLSNPTEDFQMNDSKGRVLRRMSWSSQRTHSFEVVDSESELNVNLQFSDLIPSNVSFPKKTSLNAEDLKTKSFSSHSQELQPFDCTNAVPKTVNMSGINAVETQNDDKGSKIETRYLQHLKKHKNSFKRHRIMSCPLSKDLRSASGISSAQTPSAIDDRCMVGSPSHFDLEIDEKYPSKVNVSRRIKEYQNKLPKRSSFPSSRSLSFSKIHSLELSQNCQAITRRSPPPSPSVRTLVSTNDFFPSRASFRKSREHLGRTAIDHRTVSDNLVNEHHTSLNSDNNKPLRDRMQASQSLPEDFYPFQDDSYSSEASAMLQLEDAFRTPDLINGKQFSHSTCFDNGEQYSSIANGCSGHCDPFIPTAITCIENSGEFSNTVKSASGKEISSTVDHKSNSCFADHVVETERCSHACNGAKTKLTSVSSEHKFDNYEATRKLSQNIRSSSLKVSQSLPLQTSFKNNNSKLGGQSCSGNKREAMMEKRIRAFSKLLANMSNPVVRASAHLRTMDDATGTLNTSSDKLRGDRKCFTPPPEIDRLFGLSKTPDQKSKDVGTSPVFKSEIFMQLDGRGMASPTHYSACVSMDINGDEKVNARLGSHSKSELRSRGMEETICNNMETPKSSKAQLPFKEVSKDLEELQMSIQKAKETRISASRELYFLQELLSGDSADDHHDCKLKKNKRYVKKTSGDLSEAGLQEDKKTVSGNAALNDLRDKSKKDVLEDTEFWREEIKKVKEENDRVWQERVSRMEERLKNQEQELIQAQNENDTLQRRLELQRLGASPCHCKADLQNGHGRADSAFEDDEECGNHKPSTPTHSTRQDCERLQEQLMKTEQPADELNLLLNQKLIELNKLQLTLSKQTKEMIELEKSYIQLQCRFRRGASKPVVSRLCSRSSPFATKNLFPKPSPPASPGPTSICP